MKISPSKIKKFLNEENFITFKAMLFHGENTGLIHKYINSISDRFLQNSCDKDSINKIILNYSNVTKNPDLLINEITDLSFFGTKKIVIISEVTGVISNHLKQILLTKQNTNVLILLCSNQINKKDSIHKFFESAKDLAITPCYPEKTYDIEKIVYTKLKIAGIQVQPEVVKYIANNIGEDSSQIYTEINKIINSCNKNDQITLQKARNIIGASLNKIDYDKFTSFLVEEKLQSVESELKKLLLANVQSHFIVRILTRYFTKLYIAKGLIAEGISESEIPYKLTPPIFFQNIPTFKFALKKYSVLDINKILESLLKLEIKIKSNDVISDKIILKQKLPPIFFRKIFN